MNRSAKIGETAVDDLGHEETVVIPRREYEALLKAADDLEELLAVTAYDEAKRRLVAGEEERIPSAFADRLIGGESPIRVWRDYRGLSSKDLAAAAGLSTAYLSEIETGKKDGSVAALKAIADALKIDLDDLYWRRTDDAAATAR